MIKLYGNEIWNSNTPNQYKKVIIASESQFESITDALENAGLNYCGYMNNNKSYVAVGRATVSNLDKLNISYDSIVDSNNRKYVTNNIIGTAKYNDISDKMYRKYNTDFAYKVAQRLTEQDIPFSGRIFGKNTTITVDNTYKDAINAIAHEIREQRELLYKEKAVEKNEQSATVQSSVTVSEEDNTENLFNALSVLHYKAPQLESLNSAVELLDTRPELIDLFSTMFEDTSDFKPEQLNMLSMNFVKTYSGLSDSELILANIADFNEIKQSFINTNLADKLIENRGYSYAQSELIRAMVDMGIDYDTINLLDYTFSLTEMQTFIGAYSRSDYDSLINLVAKVKGVTRSEVEGMISDGTYTPVLPDFNTLEKTLYFQESEVESITYMYYNPDAYSGGQFVITEVSYELIAEAYRKYGNDYSNFFDFLDTTGEQRLIDVGSESFRTAVKKFYSGTEFAEGLNADIQHKLVELAVVPEIKSPEVRKIELIKVGDFYEVRGENAKTVADILDLVSTTRNINGSSVDTVGFPDFKLNDNTELLKTQGFTVNIKYEELAQLEPKEQRTVPLAENDYYNSVVKQDLKRALYHIDNAKSDAERNFYQNNFDIKVRNYAGALNVSSEEIVNQFNSESEAVPVNEPEQTEPKQAAEYPEKESNAEKNNNNTELNSIDELAMQLENDEKSTSEKSSVGKNNFIWTSADEHAPVTSQPTLFDSMPVSDVSSDETTSHENYVLEDRESVTGAKTKYRNNITAIKVLKQIEADNRTATPEEQKQLSRYSGWGGLANAFESDNDKWKNEYSELKGLLTDDEYTAARSSVLDAFFTDSVIIDSIYKVMQNAGFKGGNILEPAMGIGNFFGRLPSELRENSKLYGVEKDSLSGRIAQKLYPQADIMIDGFENTHFQDNSFDVAIGNIPFGDFGVIDKKYNSQNLKIHDYFFMKSLDKVRDGGIVAFVTSKGTLDKKDSSFRKTLAERADLVGAVRLPNNAFKSAGTEVTADIIFLQKREKKSEIEPSWVHTGQLENGLTVNNYFVEHPEMILGEVVEGNKMFGRTDDTMCVPFADGRPLSELLPEAVKHITFTYSPAKEVISPVSKAEAVISKPEELRSQSYYKSGNEIYFYGSNSAGELVTVSAKDLLDKKYTSKNIDRLTAFIEIRDTLRELLEVQQHDNNDTEVERLQHKLNAIYDSFYDKYGLMHSRYNRNILGFDGAYPLVASLEQDYDKNVLIQKSDIFTQRVNIPKPQIEHIDTASEALAVCVAEKGHIDFGYMSELTDIDKKSLEDSLRNSGEIYPVPMHTENENNEYIYQTASEYLSGDIYNKLDIAETYAAVDSIYNANVTALKAALPTPLKAGDIDVNLGATWIAPEYYEKFMYKLFETPLFNRSDGIFKNDKISVEYSEYSGKWFISNKAADKSVTVTKTYGAYGYSAYQILEAALNLTEPKVYKNKLDENGQTMFDKNGTPIRVIDVPATQVVQQKANKIRREFKNWLFSDSKRRSDIVDTYNRTFNCIRPREYDGSHLRFPGMNSNIELHEHQKNAIAHAIYGGNTLFAHSVGAGKTFEMIATAMECKRLGLCHKSLFAVPNHLTEQVGADFLKLYPNANILVATKDDFKAENRKRLMSKIATGNYDAVIIGHTQLKMLPLSPERQEKIYKEQIENIVAGIAELKHNEGNGFKVKDMERTKRNLENQLEKLQSSKKDNTVYFEELGIDKLFIDEAHEFKNLFCTTKLQNVSGISSRASQRATELFAKCRYLDEKTGGKGVVFATGTPLSNSVTELHTMMRYLNYDFLASHNNMQNFDNWVSTFGTQKKEYELAPAGNKFKERTRIAEYANLPELMSMFKMIADVRTADTLNLKVPDCELHIVDVEPTELQTELVEELSDRADGVNNGSVDPSQDNMLKITGDGRKLGLDPRLIDPSFDDDPGTKLNVCVNNVFDIYDKTSEKKLTQIIFCDLGVPGKNSSADSKDDDIKSVAELDSLEESGKFCVYDDIRDKLIAKGVPADEIAYIHSAKTETQKSELFAKVRSGEVRILLGSTSKMGTGTNVQDKIIALHDLDVPWRPSDLEQRRGRMVRQGNINEKVHLYRYVTKGTFDAYSYQLLEKKQKFISQVMTSKAPGRKCADVDQAALTYSEIKALCTGDERIREKLTLENRVKELQALKSEYSSTKYELEDKVNAYPEARKKLLMDIGNVSKDLETVKSIPYNTKDGNYQVEITLGADTYSLRDEEARKAATKALTNAFAQVKGDANKNKRVNIGQLANFGIEVINDGYFLDKITATLRGNYAYSVELGVSNPVNLKKIENLLFKVENVLNDKKSELNKLDIDYKTAQNMLNKPFEFEDELNSSTKRLDELITALNIEMSEQHKSADKPKKTHYFGKDFILGKKKSSKQIQNNEVMKSEPKRSEPEL